MITFRHMCIGDPEQCEAPAVCGKCGEEANPVFPVYMWTTDDELILICGRHAPALVDRS